MSSSRKCKNCGSSDIEVDSARGDAVCTNCGSVLEDNIIVSEVQFEENAHGASSAVGQFVSADSKGGATIYGKFHVGTGTESREVTLRKSRHGISHLCHQLNLNNHCIETACNFFKMALMRHLTRGRKNTHIYAACVYITCRTEGTSHLLIDISDVLQICCYELGRTYLKLSQSLCINIPSIDPCIYIMRFANKLEFADKTHEVSMTAQRLVQRMKKDSIHSGRRPSGLCGAALLLAARMHDFNRTPNDIVRIVKIHESTLRKRLLEFGETPSSALTLDEFMTVDLEAEQDPPAFKLARRKDKERLQKLTDNEEEFTALQYEIDAALEREMKKPVVKKRKSGVPGANMEETVDENLEAETFIQESTITVLQDVIDIDTAAAVVQPEQLIGMKPDLAAICKIEPRQIKEPPIEEDGELNWDELDDEEINGYIMTEAEAKYKDVMWNKLNADYLKEVKIREERLAKEKEEGKPDKKRRRTGRRKQMAPSNTAGEAIEKMLQEKKISSKINYDILKTLTTTAEEGPEQEEETGVEDRKEIDILSKNRPKPEVALNRKPSKAPVNLGPSTSRRHKVVPAALPSIGVAVEDTKPMLAPLTPVPIVENDDLDEREDDEPDLEPEPEPQHSSIADMLMKNEDEADGDEYYDEYDEY